MTTSTDDSLSSFERDILDELFVAQTARRVAIETPPDAFVPRHRNRGDRLRRGSGARGGQSRQRSGARLGTRRQPRRGERGRPPPRRCATHACGDVLHTTEVQRSAGFELQLEQWTTPWDLVPEPLFASGRSTSRTAPSSRTPK